MFENTSQIRIKQTSRLFQPRLRGEIFALAAKTGPLYNATLTGNLLGWCAKGMAFVLPYLEVQRRHRVDKTFNCSRDEGKERERKRGRRGYYLIECSFERLVSRKDTMTLPF